ncbi:MAG: hypothetical protein EOM59_09905 [Clostridia bacterium]|nr:hypothetical protein [Clostridia bacterium]
MENRNGDLVSAQISVAGNVDFSGDNAMDNNSYPYILNNNAGHEMGKIGMGAGDIDEFMLVWDGSSNYNAYWLNHRN